MTWLIDPADEQPAPPRGGLLLALWAARNNGSAYRRVCMAVFNQTVCLAIGVVFTAVWEQSHLSVAVGVGAALVVGLVAVRARWLHDGRVFRAFLLLVGGLGYFVVTWLGSRPWCGWPVALAVGVFLAAVLPVGVRFAFPAPTARLLRHQRPDHRRRPVPQVPVSQRGDPVLPVRGGRPVRAARALRPDAVAAAARRLPGVHGAGPVRVRGLRDRRRPAVPGPRRPGPGRPERDAAVQDAVRRARLRGARGRRAGAATRPGGRRRGGYRAATGVPRRGRPGRRPAEPGGRPPVGQGRGGEPRPAR